MEKKKPIYLLDYKLKWKAFKLLQDKLVKLSGPAPEQGDKILWQMMRDKEIYCWLDPYIKSDIGLGLKVPKGREIQIITNP